MGDVKVFFGQGSVCLSDKPTRVERSPAPVAEEVRVRQELTALIAVYDAPAAAPRTEEVRASSDTDLIENIASRSYALAKEAGGDIPYTVLREVAENLIHADFREPVISVLDGGRTVRIADQGPGMADKDRAVLPGFTSATRRMKRLIRGVGSGLPIVSDYLGCAGGLLEIEDNLGEGTVVTVRSGSGQPPSSSRPPATSPAQIDADEGPRPCSPFPPLTTRQKQVLSLVMEMGVAGPTLVSKELAVALSTAYRDLAYLEHHGLIASDASGKRVLTQEGSSYLDSLFAQ